MTTEQLNELLARLAHLEGRVANLEARLNANIYPYHIPQPPMPAPMPGNEPYHPYNEHPVILNTGTRPDNPATNSANPTNHLP